MTSIYSFALRMARISAATGNWCIPGSFAKTTQLSTVTNSTSTYINVDKIDLSLFIPIDYGLQALDFDMGP